MSGKSLSNLQESVSPFLDLLGAEWSDILGEENHSGVKDFTKKIGWNWYIESILMTQYCGAPSVSICKVLWDPLMKGDSVSAKHHTFFAIMSSLGVKSTMHASSQRQFCEISHPCLGKASLTLGLQCRARLNSQRLECNCSIFNYSTPLFFK